MMIEADDLVGVAEIARLKKVGRTTVTQWAARRHRNGFPKPVKALAMGPVYDRREIEAWEPK
jgi:hypothetical protein